MKISTFFRALKIKLKQKNKQAFKSYVSLFLVMFLILSTTFAWFATKENISIQSQAFEMNGPDSIRESQMQTLQTDIVIPSFRLEEASSVDGRNIFFPATFTDNVSDDNNNDMNTQTEAMVFREGNAGDKNKLYAYANTDVSASGTDTNVWIKGYKVTLSNPADSSQKNIYHDQMDLHYDSNGIPDEQYFPDSCPIRIAVIDDSGHTPKVFDPSAKVRSEHYVTNTEAIYRINTEGKPTTQLTNLDAFSSYYYGSGHPLFTIDAGKTINVTMVAWLEGTHPHAADYCGWELRVELEIETNVNDMEMVYFHDWSIPDDATDVTFANYKSKQKDDNGHWAAGNPDKPTEVIIAMSYKDTLADTYKTTIMTLDGVDGTYGGKVYRAAIPTYVTTDISFYRLNDKDTDVHYGLIYNSWHTYSGVNNQLNNAIKNSGWKVLGDLQESRTISNIRYWHYYAIRGNGYSYVDHVDSHGSASFEKWLSPCIGYWGTEAGPVGSSSETVEPTTAPQGGGQSSSSSISNLVIKLDIPDGGTFSGNWYREDLSAHNYSMYAIFSNDNGSTEWRVQMTTAGDCSSVSLSDFSDSKFSTSTKLVGFIPVNGNDQTEKKRVGITAWSLQSNYNKNYRLTSDSWAN